MIDRYTHIIWDWNGTLFDDVDWCFSIINLMLKKRNMKTLNCMEDYHKVFCFPIVQYYENVGFDFEKEPFKELAKEYISLYHDDNNNLTLHKDAERVLRTLADNGITQIILSASEKQNLLTQMKSFTISSYFDEILGISDIYAKSKIEAGMDYIRRANIKKAVLIGDTKHDFEVAQALGTDCILISNGHQSKGDLLSCNVPVLDKIDDVLGLILK